MMKILIHSKSALFIDLHIYLNVFSNVLASASLDKRITLWNFSELTSDCCDLEEEANVIHTINVRTDSRNLIIANFLTKASPVHEIRFTRTNVIIALGTSKV